MAEGRFVLVYHEDLIANFPDVWDDDRLLATWLRLFALADKLWPTPAELPRGVSDATVRRLAKSGLLDLVSKHRYTVRGLDAKRNAASNAASNAARTRWGNAASNAETMPTHTQTKPDQTKAPPTPSKPPAKPPAWRSRFDEPRLTERELDSWATFNNRKWDPFKEAWLGRGLHYAPFGSPDDDDTSQRGLLWQIADARPNDLGRWVKEAPGRTSREVITHVLEQWHEQRAAGRRR